MGFVPIYDLNGTRTKDMIVMSRSRLVASWDDYHASKISKLKISKCTTTFCWYSTMARFVF